MGKMFNTLLLSGLASVVLFLLDGTGFLGIIGKLFLAPQTSWGSFLTDAIKLQLGVGTGVGLTAIVIGTIFSKQDWLIRAGLFTVLVSWIEAPLISLWQFMGGKIATGNICPNDAIYACSTLANGSTTGGMILAGLIMGPIVLYGIWACWSQIWSPESSG